jgi:hypothetical protein
MEKDEKRWILIYLFGKRYENNYRFKMFKIPLGHFLSFFAVALMEKKLINRRTDGLSRGDFPHIRFLLGSSDLGERCMN